MNQNLNKLSNQELLSLTKLDVSKEKEASNKVIHDLIEIDNRKLFLSMGYESLFKFVMDQFNYSESEAYTRIQAGETNSQPQG